MKIIPLFQVLCLCKPLQASGTDLLPVKLSDTGVQDFSKVVEWISNFLPVMAGNNRQINWLFLVNVHFKFNMPIVVLDIDNDDVPDLSTSPDPSIPLIFCIQVDTPEEAAAIMNKLGMYKNLYKSGKFIFISKQKPSKLFSVFLEEKSIYYSIFIKVFEDGNFEMYDSKGNNVPQNFPQLVTRVERQTIKVCYYESIPYTLIPPETKGIEQHVVDLAAQYLKLNIKYVKQNKSLSCDKTEDSKSIWHCLNDHSCDAIIGAWPCKEDFPYFDTTAYLTDTAMLIVPKVNCQRQVGMLQLDAPLPVAVLLTYFSVKLAVYLLLRNGRKTIGNRNVTNWSQSQNIFVNTKLHVKSFIESSFLISTIVFFSIFQWKIYEELVRDQGHCGIKNIEQLIDRKEKIGLDEMIYRDLVGRNASLDLWEIDEDIHNLDLNKCHIVRDISYGYFSPRRYVSANGEPLFEKVEVIMQIPIGITYFKRRSMGSKMTSALLTVLQSGISNKINNLFAGTTRAKQIAEQMAIRSNSTPAKMEETRWLFLVYLVLLFICGLVFVSEIIISKYLK